VPPICCDLSAERLHLRAFRNVFQTDFARSLIQFSGEEKFASSCPGALGYGAWVMVITPLCLSKVVELQTRTASKKGRLASHRTCFFVPQGQMHGPILLIPNLESDYFVLWEKERKVSPLRAVMVYKRSRGTDPLILNSAVYGGGRITSRPDRFTPGINHGTHRTGTQWPSWLRHCPTSWKDAGFDSRWSHWNFSLT